MSKYTNVLLFVPLIYIMLFFLYFVRIYSTEIIEFEEYVLSKQSNYAADSAIDEMILSSYLSQDYNNGAYQTYEPSVAANDYAQTMCYDFGLVPTEENIKYVLNNKVRTLAICVYDGFYMYKRQKTETNAFELAQSPKIPYFYTDKNTNRQYCLTLDPTIGFWDSGNEANYSIHKLDTYPADIKPSNDVQATTINNTVSTYLNNALFDTYSKGNMDTIVQLPGIGETVRGDQSVKAPTVIGVIDGFREVFSTIITAESIGGSQVENATYNVGYYLQNAEINGAIYSGRYYATMEWWSVHPQVYERRISDEGRYFDSVYDAARNGYTNLNLCK